MSKHYSIILAVAILFCPLVKANTTEKQSLTVGEFKRIYDPSIGEDEKWYINDHCFILGDDNTWHLFGITHAEPANPLDEDNFAHAVATKLTQSQWKKLPFALSVDEEKGEAHLWAPHIIKHEGVYYMFYCGGSPDHSNYQINLVTSKDLHNWKRHSANPLFIDGFDARDPFIFKKGDKWIMYYTATSEPEGGNHIVACRESNDLINWGQRNSVFIDSSSGTWGGPTESPTVIQRGDVYYLFIGPRGGYKGTCVYKSDTPYWWDSKDLVAKIDSHAAEIIQDTDGQWYVSHCGWGMGGVCLAPLQWSKE